MYWVCPSKVQTFAWFVLKLRLDVKVELLKMSIIDDDDDVLCCLYGLRSKWFVTCFFTANVTCFFTANAYG